MKAEINLSDSPMSAVLENFPGAQRALFRRYHIGGCSSCGFSREQSGFNTFIFRHFGGLDFSCQFCHEDLT